jgi:glycosyltransferase involved in cell wall biosynthesis
VHRRESTRPDAGDGDNPELSILVPAYDEAATIGQVLTSLRELRIDHEVIVVDDGSDDGTADIVRGHSEARLLLHEVNQGKGAAIATALAHARAPLVLVQDADLEYDPRDIPALLERYRVGDVDAVYGSRNLRPNPRSSRFFFWGGVLLSALASVLYGTRISDESTGYKLVSAELLRACGLSARGFDFCAELTGRILRSGGRIAEVPIGYRPRSAAEGKKIGARDGLIAAWILVRERVGPRRLGKLEDLRAAAVAKHRDVLAVGRGGDVVDRPGGAERLGDPARRER